VVQHFVQVRGGQDAGPAVLHRPPQEPQQLLRGGGIQGGCRLVEDDHLGRGIALGEGPRDLDHLAIADGQIRHRPMHIHGVAGKDLGQGAGDQRLGTPFPAHPAEGRMDHQHVLDGTQIRAEGQFLEDAADAEPMRLCRAIGPCYGLALEQEIALICGRPP
jgi:hypothetical protein